MQWLCHLFLFGLFPKLFAWFLLFDRERRGNILGRFALGDMFGGLLCRSGRICTNIELFAISGRQGGQRRCQTGENLLIESVFAPLALDEHH